MRASTTNLRLLRKYKIVFYASHDSREIVGEGEIQRIEFMTPVETLEKYGEKVFLDEDELEKYAMREPKKSIKKDACGHTIKTRRIRAACRV